MIFAGGGQSCPASTGGLGPNWLDLILAQSLSGLTRVIPGILASGQTTSVERTLLDDKLNALYNDSGNDCLDALETTTDFSFNEIQAKADSIQYYDVTGAAGSLLLSDVLGGPVSQDQSLATYIGTATAVTIDLNSPYVLLGNNFFNGTAYLGDQKFTIATGTAFQESVLFHELWHVLGVDHPNNTGPAFDNWLDGGCKGPQPGTP